MFKHLSFNRLKDNLFNLNYNLTYLTYTTISIIMSSIIKWDIIPPEIKNDRFYYSIIKLIMDDNTIKNIMEIGASTGEGSTEAILLGCIKNIQSNITRISELKKKVFSLEVCSERFEKLKDHYKDIKKRFPIEFYPLNMSSVSMKDFPSKDEIIEFYNKNKTTLNRYPLDMILGWYNTDIEYVRKNKIPENGIKFIKTTYNIENFDVVLIDGSEFTGFIELQQILGSKYILLDDINAFKNFNAHQFLKQNNSYKLLLEDYQTRNGFSMFVKID
jgi:hypothetical protein